MSKLTVTTLKKELKQWEQKELIQLITELYKLNGEVKDYLSSQLIGEESIQELFEKSKKKIKDEFFPDRGFGKLRLSEAKAAFSNFKKLSNDHLKTLELMLYYVELGTEFTNSYGDIDNKFYNSMISVFSQIIDACEKDEQLFELFNDRLYNIVEQSSGIGWGYADALEELYYSVEWVLDEEE